MAGGVVAVDRGDLEEDVVHQALDAARVAEAHEGRAQVGRQRLGLLGQRRDVLGDLQRLGHRDLADVGKVAVPKTLQITKDVAALAKEAQPLAANLRATLVSLRDTGGIEGLMNYIFFQVAAVNGYDAAGHYLRAGLIVNTCSTYVTEPTAGCTAKFGNGADTSQQCGGGSARVAAAHPTGDKDLDRSSRILALIAQGMGAQAAVRQVLGTPAEQRAMLRTAKSGKA